MLALTLPLLAVPADLITGPTTGTGHMSDSSFDSVVMLIENSIPGMGTSMQSNRSSGEVGFGVLPPGTTDESGQQLAGTADGDTCLVDITMDVESLASVLVHEWTHQQAHSGVFGPQVQTLSAACHEVIALTQELLYLDARATWLWQEFGFAVLSCVHYRFARDQYEEYMLECPGPLPSWVPSPPATSSHCK